MIGRILVRNVLMFPATYYKLWIFGRGVKDCPKIKEIDSVIINLLYFSKFTLAVISVA